MSNKQISTNVKNLCRLKGISLNTLIEACGLSKSFIYDFEKRDKTPSIDRISSVANYFNCSVDYLIGRTDSTRVVNIPDKIIDIVTDEYNKNPKEFISDDFIKEPPKSLIGQEYCFNASDYDKYQHIFDVAYKYTQENNIDILEVTGVDKEKYTDMVEYHSDIIEQIFTGKYYTFRDMSAYNKFCEIYKLYVKAYVQNLISDKTE